MKSAKEEENLNIILTCKSCNYSNNIENNNNKLNDSELIDFCFRCGYFLDYNNNYNYNQIKEIDIVSKIEWNSIEYSITRLLLLLLLCFFVLIIVFRNVVALIVIVIAVFVVALLLLL